MTSVYSTYSTYGAPPLYAVPLYPALYGSVPLSDALYPVPIWATLSGLGEVFQRVDYKGEVVNAVTVRKVSERFDYLYLRLTLVPFTTPKAQGGG